MTVPVSKAIAGGGTSQADVAASAPTPRRLGRYSVVREIGRGGMATVFEAVHSELGRRVALKLMHVDVREKPNAAERFFREARAAAQVRHNHIVNVFDVGTEGGTPYIVMDLVEGTDLGALLTSRGKFSVREIADLFLPISSAVWSAHRAGIVHRDLKPSNILVSEFPRAILCPIVVDFGISKSLDDGDAEPLTHSESLLGTPHYMAPEQIRGAKFVTERTDQYALGVVLYECVTGRRPFEGKNTYDLLHAITTVAAPRPMQLEPSIPREFEAIVLRAMHRDPSKRFPSMHALGCSLLSFAGKDAWSRWGPEFTGMALDPFPKTSAKTGAVSDMKSIRLDTHVDDREARRPRKTSLQSKLLVGVAAAFSIGAAATAQVVRHRSDGSQVVTREESRTLAPIAPAPAPSEPATVVNFPIDSQREAPASSVDESNPIAVAKAAPRARSGPRTVRTSPSSSAADKPAPSAEPALQRERGQNGALILE
jgi:serine/threonine-protein kinase